MAKEGERSENSLGQKGVQDFESIRESVKDLR
jgi:hypothetical protein